MSKPKSKPKIFTYWAAVPSLDMVAERKLVSLWIERWTQAGFDPVVLNEWWARQHPLYHDLKAAAARFPTSNGTAYETACFLRWLAVAMAETPQHNRIMADTDVFPYGFTPANFASHNKQYSGCQELRILQKHVPAFVIGEALAYTRQAERFIAYQEEPDDNRQVSDMTILCKQHSREPESYVYLDICKLYTEDGWDQAPLVHYSSGTMNPRGLTPKYQHIPGLR